VIAPAGPPGTDRIPRVSEPGAMAFVWGVWAVMLLAALAFVGRFGPRVPLWDDYDVIPVLTGARPLTADWLWSQHNEHRVPLPRLVLLTAYRLTGPDFRAGMVVNVVALGALALGLIAVARARRGGTRYADAFFPLVLLHEGHHANLLWSWQVQFILSTALAGTILLLIVGQGSRPGPGRAALVGACLTLLPLCGANGLAFVPALAPWLCGVAVAAMRSGERHGRRNALLILSVTVPAFLVMALYLREFQGARHHPSAAGVWEALRTGLQFLSLGLGPSGATLWPGSGLAVLGLLLLSVWRLVRVWVRGPEERLRASGLLAFLGAMGCLALGLGWGRAGSGGLAGFADRYVTLAAPTLCAVYFVWDLDGTPVPRHLVPMVLFVAMCILLWPNTQAGLDHGREVAARDAAFARDLRAGVPTFLLIKRYTPWLHPSQDALTELLPMLRRAGIGPFRSLRGNPPFREVAVPVAPTAMSQVRWEDGTARVTGVDPQLLFTLPEMRYVAGIRLRYSHANRQGAPARFQVAWKRGDQADFPADQRYALWTLPTGPDRTTTIWVADAVKQFRIQPDNQPCAFHIAALELLVP
jgi:hypothetical protein